MSKFTGDKIDHGRITLKGMESSCLTFSRLNHGIDALTDSVGEPVSKEIEDFILMADERFCGFLHRL